MHTSTFSMLKGNIEAIYTPSLQNCRKKNAERSIMSKIKGIGGDEDWAKDVRPALEERFQLLESEVRKRNSALKSAPEGTLRVIKHGNGYQFYHRTEPGDTSGKYIKKQNIKLAQGLAQKAYDKKFVELASKEMLLIGKYLKETAPEDIKHIYNNMHEHKKLLVHPVMQDDDTFLIQWKSVTYEPGFFKEGIPTYITANGERVRSKIEVNIANMLEFYGVPYRYEYPLMLGNKEKRPDFVCLNVSKRKEIIWEHFGMMDYAEYAISNVAKINAYMENGYIPGDNLIMTFETAENPLSTILIRELIESYLV